IDARSDLFSLGVVLYEVLVGERLFVGDLMSTAAAIYSQPIAPPSRRRPDLPVELDEVLLKALSLDRRGRYQSPEEFQDALSRVAAKRRLLCGASEMASILRQVCGEDPAQWLRMESLAPSSDDTHGTAILTGGGTGAVDDEFDDDNEDEPSHRSGPRLLPKKKEFTSVIALAKPQKPEPDAFDGGESKRTTMVRSPGDPIL